MFCMKIRAINAKSMTGNVFKELQTISNVSRCVGLMEAATLFITIVKTLAMERIKENIWEFFVTDL